VQQPHRGGVPQRVRGDRLAAQGRAGGDGLGDVVGDAVLDRVAAERPAPASREQRVGGFTVLLVEPVAQDGDGGRGERGDPVLAALAVAGDVRAGAKCRSARVSPVSSKIRSPVCTASSSSA
jgi:hypothetical protein